MTEYTIHVTTRFMSEQVLRHARHAFLRVSEKRVGLFSMRFTLTGPQDRLRTFCYGMSLESPKFERELLAAVKEQGL